MERNFVITKIKSVIYVGPEKYTEKRTVFRKELYYNELIFHYSGEATVYFNRQQLQTAPNTVRFLPQGSVSRYEVLRKEPGDCIDVFFCTDRPISQEAFVLPTHGVSRMGLLFKKLFALWVSKETGYTFRCMSLLYEILSQMEMQEQRMSGGLHSIDPSVSCIQKNFLGQLPDMDALAALSGISYSYMKKLFVRRFGLSPKQYIIQLKMNYACDLLRTGQYTVSQASEQCGFRDVYFFSRQFKKYMGCPPSVFAKNSAEH